MRNRPSKNHTNAGKVCAVDGCDSSAHCRLWCETHYRQWLKTGEVKPKKYIRHGEAIGGKRASEYATWGAMLSRCRNPNDSQYRYYGGRGITVCDRWKESYPSFLADMGRRPTPQHSIDRINTNGNYEPSNCRWATPKEQSRNKRWNRILTLGGVSRCVTDWAIELNISRDTIYHRLGRGLSDEQALSTVRIGGRLNLRPVLKEAA